MNKERGNRKRLQMTQERLWKHHMAIIKHIIALKDDSTIDNSCPLFSHLSQLSHNHD